MSLFVFYFRPGSQDIAILSFEAQELEYMAASRGAAVVVLYCSGPRPQGQYIGISPPDDGTYSTSEI